jgi:hypothetical protein
MNQINQDDPLKRIFAGIKLEKAPENLTGRVMDQILANPVSEPAERSYLEWWWIPVAILGALSIYLTGVFSFIYNLLIPYFIPLFETAARYFSMIAGYFPSMTIVIPSSFMVPVIFPAVLLIIIFDMLIKLQFRRI